MHKSIQDLKNSALQARRKLIEIACESGSAHIGSSLSHIDLLTALYSNILNCNPQTVGVDTRDRFILSKGHASLGYYIILAQHGFIQMEEVERFMKDGTHLAAHPIYQSAPGIEATSGSLGHGLPISVGLALGGRSNNWPSRYFTLLSDGEVNEGSTWEALLLAGHLGLDNLVAIIDYNKIQSFGRTEEILDLEPFADKIQACKWNVQEINGHDFDEIIPTLSSIPHEKGKPTCIIAHTIKGKGVPFMEDTIEWHYLNVTKENLEETLKRVY